MPAKKKTQEVVADEAKVDSVAEQPEQPEQPEESNSDGEKLNKDGLPIGVPLTPEQVQKVLLARKTKK